jgi:hypothetical protein
MTLMADDGRRYSRTPPRGYPVRPSAPVEIDPEVTPPPVDMPELAQIGAVWRTAGESKKRLDILFGTADQEGVVPAMRAALGRLDGRLVDVEKTLLGIARERDLLMLRLENMEKLLEEQAKMLKDLTEKQQAGREQAAVNTWATRLVLGALAVAGGALFQFLMSQLPR